jgi:hypothetical protein
MEVLPAEVRSDGIGQDQTRRRARVRSRERPACSRAGGSAGSITAAPFGEHQNDAAALAAADGVQLRVQAALGAPETAGKSPFFSRLAAVRCAFRWVASIISLSGLSASAASAAKMRKNTPSRLQRTKRL